jgi:hypothetical protein
MQKTAVDWNGRKKGSKCKRDYTVRLELGRQEIRSLTDASA